MCCSDRLRWQQSGHWILIVYWINYSCRSRVSVPSELCFLALISRFLPGASQLFSSPWISRVGTVQSCNWVFVASLVSLGRRRLAFKFHGSKVASGVGEFCLPGAWRCPTRARCLNQIPPGRNPGGFKSQTLPDETIERAGRWLPAYPCRARRPRCRR